MKVSKKSYFWFKKLQYLLALTLLINPIFSHANVQNTLNLSKLPSRKVLEKIIGEDPTISRSCFSSLNLFEDDDWKDLVGLMELWLNPEKLRKSLLIKMKSSSASGYKVGSSSEKKWAKYRDISVAISGTNCKIKGKYRLTGDLGDHFGISGAINHSLKIKLKTDSIGGIVKFKLFTPNSRNGDYEVLNTLLLRNLGFLAPRTARITVRIGGEKMDAIFQEDIAKEFLEYSNIHDSIIIEGDETDIFTHFANPKVVNENFFESDVNEEIIKSIFVPISGAYLKSYGLSHHIQPELLNISPFIDPAVSSDFIPVSSREEIEKFNLINFAMNSVGGISLHDHRFVYDHISRMIRPIYYDGHSNVGYSKVKSFFTNFQFNEKSRLELIEKIKTLDVLEFIEIAAEHGVTKSQKQIISFLDETTDNLTKFKPLKGYLDKKNKWDEFTKKRFVQRYAKAIRGGELNPFNLNIPTLKFYWLEKQNTLNECFDQKENFECKTRSISTTETNNLPIGRVQNIKDGHYLFGFNEKTKSYYDLVPFKFNALPGVVIEASPHIIPVVDTSRKVIAFKKSDKILRDGQIRIHGGKLEDWKIFVSSNLKLGYKRFENDRRSLNAYTGCLTISDMEVKNISIKLGENHCEDSIHFVRVKGSIKSLRVEKTFSDAIDADFSQIKFDEISVSQAGNDCIDLSAGNYQAEVINLSNCKDKAISVGEKAVFKANNVIIDKSLLGIVAKDQAIADIINLSVRNTSVCAMAYRKKQEFKHGIIRVDTANCGTSPSYFQKGSKIGYQ